MKKILIIEADTNDADYWEQEKEGLLQTVFKDGVLVKTTTLNKIRELLNSQIN